MAQPGRGRAASRPAEFGSRLAALIALLAAPAAALASPAPFVDPNSGIEFVRVGAVGNRSYDGPDPQSLVRGRGGVGYEYAMGRFEITTAQWMEYVNAYSARADAVPLFELGQPVSWGAGRDPTYTGPGTRYRLRAVDNAAMLPVGGLSWRQAAMYCNWLHNGKATNREAFLNGAYDVSTFGFSGTTFTDQLTHHPGARYWIPTWDEWLKAAHYDPGRPNADGTTGGWWQYSITSDAAPAYGPAGVRVRARGRGRGAGPGPRRPAGAGERRVDLGGLPGPLALLDPAGGVSGYCKPVGAPRHRGGDERVA